MSRWHEAGSLDPFIQVVFGLVLPDIEFDLFVLIGDLMRLLNNVLIDLDDRFLLFIVVLLQLQFPLHVLNLVLGQGFLHHVLE